MKKILETMSILKLVAIMGATIFLGVAVWKTLGASTPEVTASSGTDISSEDVPTGSSKMAAGTAAAEKPQAPPDDFNIQNFVCVTLNGDRCDSWDAEIALPMGTKRIYLSRKANRIDVAPTTVTVGECEITYQDSTKDACSAEEYTFPNTASGQVVTHPIELPDNMIKGSGIITLRLVGPSGTTVTIPVNIK